jgi:hypothetical protein
MNAGLNQIANGLQKERQKTQMERISDSSKALTEGMQVARSYGRGT